MEIPAGSVFHVIAVRLTSTPLTLLPRWGLLFWLARASQLQEKRWGCSLPPPFLSLPLIGSRWRNITLEVLRQNGHSSLGLAKLGSLGRCNPWSGRSVVRSTPGGTLSSRGPYKPHHGFSPNTRRRRGSLLLQWWLAASVSSLILRTGRPLYN